MVEIGNGGESPDVNVDVLRVVGRGYFAIMGLENHASCTSCLILSTVF